MRVKGVKQQRRVKGRQEANGAGQQQSAGAGGWWRRLTPEAADTREAGEETAESVLRFFLSADARLTKQMDTNRDR